MNRLAFLLCLLATPALADEPWTHNAAHLAGGAILGYGVTELTDRPWAGVLAGCGAGAVKEFVMDENADMGDLSEWCFGGAFGAALNALLNVDSRLRFTPVLDTAGGPGGGMFLEYTVVRW